MYYFASLKYLCVSALFYRNLCYIPMRELWCTVHCHTLFTVVFDISYMGNYKVHADIYGICSPSAGQESPKNNKQYED